MIKLAFSTLGCPDWSWKDIFASAKDLHMDGIEVRGVADELFAPAAKPFLPENIDATRVQLQKSGLVIQMFTTGGPVGDAAAEQSMAECRAYIDLAQRLSTPYVRVMAADYPQPTPTDLDLAAANFAALCDYAAPKGVTPLIETNGVLADSDEMLRFLHKVDRPNAGVLWDVHHPYRYYGETPEQTYGKLGPYIRHLHVKDSVMENGKVSYRMLGHGDVPVFDCLRMFADDDRVLFASLEWVKRWNPDLTEPGVVFPQYADYMRYLLRKFM